MNKNNMKNMIEFATDKLFENRIRHAISVAWHVFSRKVGGGLIKINKEASIRTYAKSPKPSAS